MHIPPPNPLFSVKLLFITSNVPTNVLVTMAPVIKELYIKTMKKFHLESSGDNIYHKRLFHIHIIAMTSNGKEAISM